MSPSALLAQTLVQVEPYLRERGDTVAADFARGAIAAASAGSVGARAWARHVRRVARSFLRNSRALQLRDRPRVRAGLNSEAVSLLGLASLLRAGAAAMEAS